MYVFFVDRRGRIPLRTSPASAIVYKKSKQENL
jgi:hypothetical protein